MIGSVLYILLMWLFLVLFFTQWMRHMWKSDPCYEAHGVDGSDCSFIMYLSEVRLLIYYNNNNNNKEDF